MKRDMVGCGNLSACCVDSEESVRYRSRSVVSEAFEILWTSFP